MSVNKLTSNSELEQSAEFEHLETEKKYTVSDPNYFDFLANICAPKYIEQIYLSNPGEPANLRVREINTVDGSIKHTATLKVGNHQGANGLERLETPTPINAEAFDFYQNSGAARLKKIRVEPVEGVSIDWIEGYHTPIVEIENMHLSEEAQLFFQQYGDVLIDRTGKNEVDNEWIAHHLSGKEQEALPEEPNVIKMADLVLGYVHYGISPVVATIDGRSGSGKTTVALELQALLNDKGVETVVLSTDDYHRGKSWLEEYNDGKQWLNWDKPIVYDTEAMTKDITELSEGRPIEHRLFSFKDEECYVDGLIQPTKVIIVEGVHGGTKDLDSVRHLHFAVETPQATSTARDLARLRDGNRANDSIGSPEDRLRENIEFAEPTFRSLERAEPSIKTQQRRKIGGKVLQIRNGKVIRPNR